MKCNNCGDCCKTVAVEIDTPKTKRDIEDMKWFLFHRGINIVVDRKKNWSIEFKTKCKYLDKNNKCKIYNKRPPVCKKFSAKQCNDKDYDDHLIENVKDLKEFTKDLKIKN